MSKERIFNMAERLDELEDVVADLLGDLSISEQEFKLKVMDNILKAIISIPHRYSTEYVKRIDRLLDKYEELLGEVTKWGERKGCG